MNAPSSRQAHIARKTTETDIQLSLNLDGNGVTSCATGVGFFDHMLDQLGKHALMDLVVKAKGDTHIDDHHTVEDTGIALGQALHKALGEKRGLRRYGHCHLVMDEALSEAAVDLSGRAFLVFDVYFPSEKIGQFDCELVREFFQALAMQAKITLHIRNIYGENSHHIAESCFKAVARALRMAMEKDDRLGDGLASTKGTLSD
jgi:imidazoleglycerol-phosphate dehydratase